MRVDVKVFVFFVALSSMANIYVLIITQNLLNTVFS